MLLRMTADDAPQDDVSPYKAPVDLVLASQDHTLTTSLKRAQSRQCRQKNADVACGHMRFLTQLFRSKI